jgi:hypothetical protein
MHTLYSSYELVKLSPINIKFDANALCPVLDIEEEKLFRTCLGMELYDAMLADKKPLPLATNFSASRSYSVGEHVVLNGVYYVCFNAYTANGVFNDSFTEFKKFNSDVYNELSHRYLAKLISFTCIRSIVVYKYLDFTNIGVVKNKTENSDSADTKDISMYKHELEGDIADLYDNMIAYMKRKGLLSVNAGCNSGCGEPINPCCTDLKPNCEIKKRRNFGFNV